MSTKKKRRVSGEGSGKQTVSGDIPTCASAILLVLSALRRCFACSCVQPRARANSWLMQTIKDAFSKQQQKSSLPSLQDELETQVQPKLVPEVFLEEVLKVYEVGAWGGNHHMRFAWIIQRTCKVAGFVNLMSNGCWLFAPEGPFSVCLLWAWSATMQLADWQRLHPIAHIHSDLPACDADPCVLKSLWFAGKHHAQACQHVTKQLSFNPVTQTNNFFGGCMPSSLPCNW